MFSSVRGNFVGRSGGWGEGSDSVEKNGDASRRTESERDRKSEDPWLRMARVVLSRCARTLSSLQPSSPPFALRIRSLKVVRCADSALDGRRVERDEIIDFIIF